MLARWALRVIPNVGENSCRSALDSRQLIPANPAVHILFTKCVHIPFTSAFTFRSPSAYGHFAHAGLLRNTRLVILLPARRMML
jgi:hypothetical protein